MTSLIDYWTVRNYYKCKFYNVFLFFNIISKNYILKSELKFKPFYYAYISLNPNKKLISTMWTELHCIIIWGKENDIH